LSFTDMTITALLHPPLYFMAMSRRNYCYRWVGFYGSATKHVIFWGVRKAHCIQIKYENGL